MLLYCTASFQIVTLNIPDLAPSCLILPYLTLLHVTETAHEISSVLVAFYTGER